MRLYLDTDVCVREREDDNFKHRIMLTRCNWQIEVIQSDCSGKSYIKNPTKQHKISYSNRMHFVASVLFLSLSVPLSLALSLPADATSCLRAAFTDRICCNLAEQLIGMYNLRVCVWACRNAREGKERRECIRGGKEADTSHFFLPAVAHSLSREWKGSALLLSSSSALCSALVSLRALDDARTKTKSRGKRIMW